MKIQYKTNLVTGIFSTIMGIVLFIIIPFQIRVEKNILYNVSSRTLPYVISCIFIVCGILLIIQSIILKKEKIKSIDLRREFRIMIYFISLILYILTFEKNFIISTVSLGIFTLFMTKSKKPLFYIITIIVVFILYYIFTKLLHVRLP